MVYLNSSGAAPTKTGEVKTPCGELNLSSLVGLLRKPYQALYHGHTTVIFFYRNEHTLARYAWFDCAEGEAS